MEMFDLEINIEEETLYDARIVKLTLAAAGRECDFQRDRAGRKEWNHPDPCI